MIFQLETSRVTLFDVVIPAASREKFFQWAENCPWPVHLKRSGPAPIYGQRGRFHTDRMLMTGYIEAVLTTGEVEESLRKVGMGAQP